MSKELEALECFIETIRMFGENQIGLDRYEEKYNTIKQALIQKPKVMIDYYTKVKINRYFELWYKVDCDGDEILHDMKTPQEVEEMHNLRKELEEMGIEV